MAAHPYGAAPAASRTGARRRSRSLCGLVVVGDRASAAPERSPSVPDRRWPTASAPRGALDRARAPTDTAPRRALLERHGVRSPRGAPSRRSSPAWRRPWSAAASACRRPWSPPPPPRPRSRCASSSRARARATSAPACCRCGPTSPRTRCPTTIPAALERRVRVAYPCASTACSAAARRPRCGSSARSARPAASRRGRRRSCGRTGCGSRSPRDRAVPARCATATASRAAPRGSTPRSTSASIGYWAVPTAPPWYAARKGLMADGRTPELRRMMVEYGEAFWGSRWASLYGVLGGNPLAAMPSLHFATSVTAAHLLAETGRAAGRAWAGRTPRRWAWRSSTWASTTSSTWRPAWRSPRASARRDAARRACRARASAGVRALEALARR